MPTRYTEDENTYCLTTTITENVTVVTYDPFPIWTGLGGGTVTLLGGGASFEPVPGSDDGVRLKTSKLGDGFTAHLTGLPTDVGDEIRLTFEGMTGMYKATLTDDSTGEILGTINFSQSDGNQALYKLPYVAHRGAASLSITSGMDATGDVVVHAGVPHYTIIPVSVVANVCNNESYRYGFNGQMKVNEIAGVGNHNTALFWEYDTRTGRRWNKDPKPSPDESQYATIKGNPIQHSDPNGDCPPGVDCGLKASVSLTIGTRGQSRANFAIGFGASKTGNGFMSGANLSLNMYTGGPGTNQANTGKSSFGGAVTLGLSGTWGGGSGTPTDLNIFNSSTLSGIKNKFAESYTVGTNITWNNATGFNRAAGYAFKKGGFAATLNEDFTGLPWGSNGGRSFFGGGLLASGKDEGETGGGFASFTFKNGTSLSLGTEIFTGAPSHYPKLASPKYPGYVDQIDQQQRLNVGRTFLILQGMQGGDWRLDYSGSSNMYSQDAIHSTIGIEHFRSTATNSLQLTH